MPASALGHGAFPFWDASFVRQSWASTELCQAQLCRDFFFFFAFLNVVCLFFICKDLIKWSCCGLRAVHWRYGVVNSPPAHRTALSCPVLCCLQGHKAFLSACPSLLLSGDFVERRSCYGAVEVWGISQSPSQQGRQRGAQHVKFPPLDLKGRVKGCQAPPKSRWISWMLYFQTIF